MATRRDVADRNAEDFSGIGVVAPIPIQVDCAVFQGSLALLFACVRERKIDLAEVPLAPICAAYCSYLLESERRELDGTAAALTALAYLLERKAWGMLPIPDPEPVQEEFLGLPAASIDQFEPAIFALRLGLEKRSALFFRAPDSGPNAYELPYSLCDVSPADLGRALDRVLRRANPEALVMPARQLLSLSEVMALLLSKLSSEWGGLEYLMPSGFTRTDAVWSFLAILELIRLGQASVRLNRGNVEFARRPVPVARYAEPARAGAS